MVSDKRRLSRRFAAPIASLVFVAVVVAACSSAALSGTTANSAAVLQAAASPTGAALVPAVLPSATSTPATSLASSASALSLQDQMVAVIKQVSPSVVEIQTDAGLGSGIVYDSRGDIITNAHVVGTSTTFTVTLSNGKTYPATLVGSYAPDDIAVLHITASGLSPATFGDSSKLSVGDFVLAMGNPLGLQSSVTEGIVSALGRQVSEPTGNALPDVIQTSAAINPGNSGGALVDLSGEVVGIPTLTASDPQLGGSAPGIGFAISSDRAKTIADQLIASGKVTNSGRAYMGVQLTDGTTGPVIVAVTAGGPAAAAGVQVGDVVISIDSTLTPDSQTLIDAVAAYHPGDTIKLKVQHQDGTTATLNLTLGQLPS
ncbi:MAG TPA: trypsin-like peptidase domain-containing protein [Candidatus Limnocylindrales bacterium]|jgi:S1-C subfamily serine protease